MLFLNRPANWDNRDYRAYCDHRTRQKRRLGLGMSIGLALALMVLMVLVGAWVSTTHDEHRAGVVPGIVSQAGSADGSGRLPNTS